MAALSFLNTNVVLRHLTQDSATLSPRATALIRRIEAGELVVRTTDTIVFEKVFTLQGFYGLPRHHIEAIFTPLLRLRSSRIAGKRRYQRTFELYVRFLALSFADCDHAAYMESQGLTDLISFNRDMDRVTTITRKESDAAGGLTASRRARS